MGVEEVKAAGFKGKYIEPEAYGQPRESGAVLPESLKKENQLSVGTENFKEDHKRMVEEAAKLHSDIQQKENADEEPEINYKPQTMPTPTDISPNFRK